MVPIDGSNSSKGALQEALKIVKLTKGAITLTHVYSTGSSIVMTSTQRHLNELALKEGKNVLTEGKKQAKDQGVEAQTLLLEGEPAEQIVKAAKEGNYDLIVIGARGLSKITELILGSVSHAVIKNAPCPVLVTR